MSKREATLCDVRAREVWSSGKIKTERSCDKLAVAVCPLCNKDVCDDHALHPAGGLILRAESIMLQAVAGSPPREIPWGTNANGNAPSAPYVRIAICRTCRAVCEPVIQGALVDAAAHFVKLLGAALSAKALETP